MPTDSDTSAKVPPGLSAHAPSHLDPSRSGCKCVCDCSDCLSPTGLCICFECGPEPHVAQDEVTDE